MMAEIFNYVLHESNSLFLELQVQENHIIYIVTESCSNIFLGQQIFKDDSELYEHST